MRCTQCKTINNYYHTHCYKCGNELIKQDDVQNYNDSDDGQIPIVILKKGHMLEKQVQRTTRIKKLTAVVWIATILLFAVLAYLLSMLLNIKSNNNSTVIGQSIGNYELTLSFSDDLEDIIVIEGNEAIVNANTNASIIEVDGLKADTAIDEEGNCEIVIPVEDYGENHVTIRAIAQNGDSIKKQLIIFRKYTSIQLAFNPEQIFSTETNQLLISGTVSKGTELELSTDLEYEIEHKEDSETFNIWLSNIPVIPGKYSFDIVAFSPEFGTYTQTIDVERQFNIDIYKTSAISSDYTALTSQDDTSAGYTIFQISGRVQEIIQRYPTQIFTFYVNNDSDDIALIEYYGEKAIKNGERFQVYGELMGYVDIENINIEKVNETEGAIPKIYARIIE